MVYRSHLRIRFIITTFDIIDKKKKNKKSKFLPEFHAIVDYSFHFRTYYKTVELFSVPSFDKKIFKKTCFRQNKKLI